MSKEVLGGGEKKNKTAEVRGSFGSGSSLGGKDIRHVLGPEEGEWKDQEKTGD